MKEIGPPATVFLVAFDHPENLAVSLATDTDGDQYRDIADLTTPGAFKDDAVEVNVGKFLCNGAIAPLFDFVVHLLVEFADRTGTHLVSQRASVMSSTRLTETPAKLHLDQGLFDGSFPAPVALDNGRFKDLTSQLGHV